MYGTIAKRTFQSIHWPIYKLLSFIFTQISCIEQATFLNYSLRDPAKSISEFSVRFANENKHIK